jgi:hypothetical protein
MRPRRARNVQVKLESEQEASVVRVCAGRNDRDRIGIRGYRYFD